MCAWGIGLTSVDAVPHPIGGLSQTGSLQSVFSGARQIAILRLLHTGDRFCRADDGDVVG